LNRYPPFRCTTGISYLYLPSSGSLPGREMSTDEREKGLREGEERSRDSSDTSTSHSEQPGLV
jgi:hypothetical protein